MNLALQLDSALAPEDARLLREAGALALRSQTPLYLVGGSVRDLLLVRPILDLDLAVEGDVSILSHALATHLSGQVTRHSQFGTAKIEVGKRTIDLAATRRETYARPGALPTVAPGSIHDDLLRRDFTINAMAVHLSPNQYGQTLDVVASLEDLRNGLVRVLHDNSFRDDPTRILRASRYEQRLGFKMEKHTEELLHRDLSYLDSISPDRVRHELERILEEADSLRPLLRAADLGILEAVYPPLQAISRRRDSLYAINNQKYASPLLHLALLVWPLPQQDTEGLIQRLHLKKRQMRVVRDTQRIKEIVNLLASPALKPSQVYHTLSDLTPEAIQAGALALEEIPIRKLLQQYVERWRYVRPSLTGRDLLHMGIPKGPRLGQLLKELRLARLDGEVSSRAEEKALVKRNLYAKEV